MNTTIKRVSAFNYFGGKSRYLDFILPNIPSHKLYVEPFCGSCVVLLNKPVSKVEIINDMDSRIMNFFRIVREHPEELIQLLELTPYSKNEYEYALQVSQDPIEEARRFFIRAMMNFGGSPSGFTKRKSSIRFSGETRNGISAQISKLLDKTKGLREVSERIRLCQIDNRNALEVIKISYVNSPDTFIFEDPPYPPDSRSSTNDYSFEMTRRDHEKLAEINHDLKAKIMICSYPSDTMKSLYADWNMIHGPSRATNIGKKRSKEKIECIWTNYQVRQTNLFKQNG